MRGSISLTTIFALGALGAALLLAGCASDPGWGVPPHPSARFTQVTTGSSDCNPSTHPDGSPGCYSQAKQKAIKRYEDAKKKGH